MARGSQALSEKWEKTAAAINSPTGFALDEHQLTDLGAATGQQRCAHELRETLLSLMADQDGRPDQPRPDDKPS